MMMATGRLKRESNPQPGQLASPVPQAKDRSTGEWEEVESVHGAPLAALIDPATGQPWPKVPVADQDAAEALEHLLLKLSNDPATNEQLKAILGEAVADPGVHTLLARLKALETDLEAIKGMLVEGTGKMQLSGQREEVMLFDGLALRDYERHISMPIDLRKYKRVALFAIRTFNEPLTVWLRIGSIIPFRGGWGFNDTSDESGDLRAEFTSARYYRYHFLNKAPGFDVLDGPVLPPENMYVVLRASEENNLPTSGSVTIRLVGEVK